MKLILSSCDFHEETPKRAILQNLPKPAEECRVLFIPNEHANERTLQMDKYNRRLRQKGFARAHIFVFDHTRPRDFFDLDADLIYVSGGNTFLTLQKLRDTGFDREIVRRVRAGTLYIGGSAGAHIVSKSVAHIARYDEVPDGFSDFSGLGLVDALFVCHFSAERSAHFEELRRAGERVFALTNEETLIFEDGKVTRVP